MYGRVFAVSSTVLSLRKGSLVLLTLSDVLTLEGACPIATEDLADEAVALTVRGSLYQAADAMGDVSLVDAMYERVEITDLRIVEEAPTQATVHFTAQCSGGWASGWSTDDIYRALEDADYAEVRRP